MARCPKCGTEGSSKFCPNCGATMVEERKNDQPVRCPNCGTENTGRFCSNCGTAINEEAKAYYEAERQSGQYNAPNSAPNQNGAYSQPGNNYGAYSGPGANQNGAYSQPGNNYGAYSQPGNNYGAYSQPGMNQNGMGASPGYNGPQSSNPNNYKLGWHKFLIYFALFASGVLNVVNSISWFKLAPYIPVLSIIGVLEVALAIFMVYVRFPLAGFKKGAPKLLLIGYAAVAGINIIVAIINVYYASLSPYYDITSTILKSLSGVIIPVVMIFANWRYYSSREGLFIN